MTFIRWCTFDKHDPIDSTQPRFTVVYSKETESTVPHPGGRQEQGIQGSRPHRVPSGREGRHLLSAHGVIAHYGKIKKLQKLHSVWEGSNGKNHSTEGHRLPSFVRCHHGTQYTIYRIDLFVYPWLPSKYLRNRACVLITFINSAPSRGAGIWWLLNKHLPSESPTPLPSPHTLLPFTPWTFFSVTITHRDQDSASLVQALTIILQLR